MNIYHGWTESPERIAARWQRICERADAYAREQAALAERAADYMALPGNMIAVCTNSGKVAKFMEEVKP